MRKRQICAAPLLRARAGQRPRLTWLQALILVAAVTTGAVLAGATLVTLTDPDRYPDFITALWWSVTTVTTVGYGDVVPATAAGRLVGAILMFVGIGSFALLTAVAASAIVVGEVGDEERRIEREEQDIRRGVAAILGRLEMMDDRLRRLEGGNDSTPGGRRPKRPPQR
jgi:voltage-gated potassium channel